MIGYARAGLVLLVLLVALQAAALLMLSDMTTRLDRLERLTVDICRSIDDLGPGPTAGTTGIPPC